MKIYFIAIIFYSLAFIIFSQTATTSATINPTNTTVAVTPTTPAADTLVEVNVAFTADQLDVKDVPALTGRLQNLTSTEPCINRLKNLLSYMSESEQLSFYNAYVEIKKNSTTVENTGRCFSPGILKKAFNKIAKGTMNTISGNLTNQSKNIKNSFSCVKKAFDSVKAKSNYTASITQFVNTQALANQCLSNFLKNLHQILGSRRRYLLLNTTAQVSTGLVKNDVFVGFPWLSTEVSNITTSFLQFAECYQSLPDALTKVFSEVISTLSDDPVCVSTTLRNLQTASVSGNTTVAANTTTPVVAANSTTSANVNATVPAVNVNNTVKNNTGIVKKPKASANKVTLGDVEVAWMNTVVANYNKKTGDYTKVAGLLTTFTTSTTLKSKCNFVNQINSFLDQSNTVLIKQLNVELSKLKKGSPCIKTDYLFYLSKPSSSNVGTVSCVDADTTQCTVNSSVTFKNSDNTQLEFVSGCSAGTRFAFAYSVNTNLGTFLEFSANNAKTCKTGESSKCSKSLANLAVSKTYKLLQATTTTTASASSCLPAMQKNCNDAIANACKSSNLLSFIGQNPPSTTDSALPDDCLNIDPENPSYTKCFTWINKNLLIYTLFPNLKAITNIQSTIVASQSATVSLRYLQTASSSDEIKIVESDASSTDTTAQLSPDQYAVTSSDITIDGTNADTTGTVTVDIDAINASTPISTSLITPTTPTTTTNSLTFIRIDYLLILLLLVIFI